MQLIILNHGKCRSTYLRCLFLLCMGRSFRGYSLSTYWSTLLSGALSLGCVIFSTIFNKNNGLIFPGIFFSFILYIILSWGGVWDRTSDRFSYCVVSRLLSNLKKLTIPRIGDVLRYLTEIFAQCDVLLYLIQQLLISCSCCCLWRGEYIHYGLTAWWCDDSVPIFQINNLHGVLLNAGVGNLKKLGIIRVDLWFFYDFYIRTGLWADHLNVHDDDKFIKLFLNMCGCGSF